MTLGLGVDTGGTFTDAAIVDLDTKKVLVKAKARTTYHDLSIGIIGAVVRHPLENWDDLESYRPPDPDETTHWGPIDWEKEAEDAGPAISQKCLPNGEIGHNHTWLRLIDLRGYQNVILDMAEQLIGPDICLWNMSFFAKPALNGKRTPYHQDGEYWPIRPLATCTAWIAVDEATEENGCLKYIPGSHKTARLMAHEVSDDPEITLNRELARNEYDESKAESLILPAGGMAFHDVYIAHGSEQNRSPKPRRGMTLRLMPTSSVYDRALARQRHGERGGFDMSHHSIFLLRGRDVSGQNDFAVRPTL